MESRLKSHNHGKIPTHQNINLGDVSFQRKVDRFKV
ncbi:MAG: hypothetical protein JRD87_03025 [Deltaproteobacteria bacterium]|nr:hypothetical protein [Deltaproteobacteria bacterium]MBW2237656.1 hypothetical protein [Deltaproteobacteria bacterium]MBW2571422.1 hypothetical protein [Deltaproteobacteria bacterium]MBW2668858.1 hypothetical protein [Deltaproteobacteria bacterium]